MNRLLLIGLFLCFVVTACQKETTDAELAQIQLGKDTVIIKDYLAANGLTNVAIKDKATGEYYIIDTLGTGNVLFTSSTLITVGYKGSVLGSTTLFAQTNNFHPSFALGGVIQGWQIGIPHIKKGGVIRLFVPSGYAYGPYDQPDLKIPANSVLDFTIKLYDIAN
ncbi:FKBP-type peptidyl-prolyl cis-trans isomerase [Mucilaginibacter sp. AW1-3]